MKTEYTKPSPEQDLGSRLEHELTDIKNSVTAARASLADTLALIDRALAENKKEKTAANIATLEAWSRDAAELIKIVYSLKANQVQLETLLTAHRNPSALRPN